MCGCDLGMEVKNLAFYVNDGSGVGGGKVEAFCAQDFVWKRAPMDPVRFFADAYQAIKCAKCGVVSVDCGLGQCGQCGWRVQIVLPPKF